MKITAYLFINRDGSLRITKRDSSSYASELAVHLVVDVPDIFFKRPMPRVEVSVPEEFLINPNAEVVAQWVAPNIADALGLEVKRVEDGMMAMIREDMEARELASPSPQPEDGDK